MLPLLPVLLVLAAFLTAILSGILGMAGGFILMGLAAWMLPVAGAMVFHGVTQFASNGSRALVLRGHVRGRIVGMHALGGLLAFAVLSVASFTPDRASLLIVLGCVPFIARLMPKSRLLDASIPASAAACGFLTTGLQLVAGVSGPLLDTWFVDSPLTRHEIVATKAATQALSHALKVARFAPLLVASGAGAGDVSPALLLASAIAALFGTSVGTRLLDRVPEVRFRSWTRATVLALGVAYLAQGCAAR